MRKVFWVSILLAGFVVMSSSVSQAQLRRDRDYLVGKITKVNPKNQSISLIDQATNTEKKYTVENGWENVKEGQRVVVSVQKGSDIIKSLKPALR